MQTAQSVEEEWWHLEQNYVNTVKALQGCDPRSQCYIDRRWEHLQAFVTLHTEFACRLPVKTVLV